MNERLWEPDDPPALEGLKDWCSDEVDQAIRHVLANAAMFLSQPANDEFPTLVFSTDFPDGKDGEENSLYTEAPLLPLLEEWLDGDPDFRRPILTRMLSALLDR